MLCVVRRETIRYYRPDDLARTNGSFRVDDVTPGYETLLSFVAEEQESKGEGETR